MLIQAESTKIKKQNDKIQSISPEISVIVPDSNFPQFGQHLWVADILMPLISATILPAINIISLKLLNSRNLMFPHLKKVSIS